MARTAEQKAQLVSDYIAAFKRANPDATYPLEVTYDPTGWVLIYQDGHKSKYRPGAIPAMIERLNKVAGA